MEEFFTFDNLIQFMSLSGLEIILGIDNVIFIAIITSNIEKSRRKRVRFFGISLAIALRIVMLTGASWVMTLNSTLFKIISMEFTGRSLLLLAGGLFLVVKSIKELILMLRLDLKDDRANLKPRKPVSEMSAIYQIIFVDLILSFDSVIVAVGMVNSLALIIPAILIAMVAMLLSAQAIGEFISTNPSIKVLGIGFVLLIGVFLTLDGLNISISKSYIYAAMFFSLAIELMNIRVKRITSK